DQPLREVGRVVELEAAELLLAGGLEQRLRLVVDATPCARVALLPRARAALHQLVDARLPRGGVHPEQRALGAVDGAAQRVEHRLEAMHRRAERLALTREALEQELELGAERRQ